MGELTNGVIEKKALKFFASPANSFPKEDDVNNLIGTLRRVLCEAIIAPSLGHVYAGEEFWMRNRPPSISTDNRWSDGLSWESQEPISRYLFDAGKSVGWEKNTAYLHRGEESLVKILRHRVVVESFQGAFKGSTSLASKRSLYVPKTWGLKSHIPGHYQHVE